MKIYLQNFTAKTYAEMRAVIKAINIQLKQDFAPLWDTTATIIYAAGKTDINPDTLKEGDAIIYLRKEADVQGALGYHSATNKGTPVGFVFTDISDKLGEPWSVTLSHEVLELVSDPLCNILAIGPHPKNKNRAVAHWYEMCDAVQREQYKIGTVLVSNFVTPTYFTVQNEGKRTNIMGTDLASFDIRPGGYVGFYDPVTGQDDTYMARGDKLAKKRLAIKSGLGALRRGNRYKSLGIGTFPSWKLGL